MPTQHMIAEGNGCWERGALMYSYTRSHKPMNKIGRRPNAWIEVWRFLKPRLKAAGRTECEFDFLKHDCVGPIDPCHSKKRGKMRDLDIYEVALGCRQIHDYLDGLYAYPPLGRRMSHEEMESAVMRAIENHGGLILPERY